MIGCVKLAIMLEAEAKTLIQSKTEIDDDTGFLTIESALDVLEIFIADGEIGVLGIDCFYITPTKTLALLDMTLDLSLEFPRKSKEYRDLSKTEWFKLLNHSAQKFLRFLKDDDNHSAQEYLRFLKDDDLSKIDFYVQIIFTDT